MDRGRMASEVDRPYASRMAKLNMPMLGSDAKRHRPHQHGQNQNRNTCAKKICLMITSPFS